MADMTYTFGDQLDLMDILLGDPNTTDDDMFPLAIRKKYINRGEIKFALDSKSMRDYVGGNFVAGEIALPANWLKTHVLLIDGRKADQLEIALQDYERYASGGDNYWYQWEVSDVEQITLVNQATATLAYKLWYFKKPTVALDDIADVSIIPSEYREASVYWGASELVKQIGKLELAMTYMQIYASYINSAIADVKEKYMDRPNPNVDNDGDTVGETDRQGHGSY